jgi:hypothetical protein
LAQDDLLNVLREIGPGAKITIHDQGAKT